MTDFLPEYRYLPWKGGYRPMFRLFTSDRWKLVRRDGEPVSCDTAGQALAEAKECVRRILNPEIRAEMAEAVPKVPDFLNPEIWDRDRKAREVQEQQEAFGTIFVRSKPVKVELAKRRARA
ncbi:hypothetical protein C7441_112160 [Pseudaminobacter salicylatoxidans]|uniref:Uncharacterized protein n=1 Tax=Pseudaminobacter salicylatoxidans TaxID=93369 RepID=A0A316C176_PSESE|nr:hypothetical protein [Pseudaminobacter salicylatoxidans]PWJ80618.1 hypothetical protein C7441_112160 [Pseudaminobacter salicylatoxidans]